MSRFTWWTLKTTTRRRRHGTHAHTSQIKIIFPPRPWNRSVYAYVVWRGGAEQERRWHSSNLSARLCRLINRVRDYHAPREVNHDEVPRFFVPCLSIYASNHSWKVWTRAHLYERLIWTTWWINCWYWL